MIRISCSTRSFVVTFRSAGTSVVTRSAMPTKRAANRLHRRAMSRSTSSRSISSHRLLAFSIARFSFTSLIDSRSACRFASSTELPASLFNRHWTMSRSGYLPSAPGMGGDSIRHCFTVWTASPKNSATSASVRHTHLSRVRSARSCSASNSSTACRSSGDSAEASNSVR